MRYSNSHFYRFFQRKAWEGSKVLRLPNVVALWRNIIEQNWGNAAFAGFNAITAMWAIFAYIGIGNLLADIWFGLTDWMYVEYMPKSVKQVKKVAKVQPALTDWKVVLYHGEKEGIVPHASLSDLMVDRKAERIAV